MSKRSIPVVALDQIVRLAAAAARTGAAVRRRRWGRHGDRWIVGLSLVAGCAAVVAVTIAVIAAHPHQPARTPLPGAEAGRQPDPSGTPTATQDGAGGPRPSGPQPPDGTVPEGTSPGGSSSAGTAGGSLTDDTADGLANDGSTSGGSGSGGSAGGSGSGAGSGGSGQDDSGDGGDPPDGDTPPESGGQANLTARYATESTDLLVLGYQGAVTIRNVGTAQADGWRVTVTLSLLSLTVSDVTGADASQAGGTWIFTPLDNTRQVPAGGSVRIGFQVTGVTVAPAPTGCTIDTRPCDGL